MGKKDLTEEDIKNQYITPALNKAGWDPKMMRMEYAYTAGRIILHGKMTARGKQKKVDYLLYYKSNNDTLKYHSFYDKLYSFQLSLILVAKTGWNPLDLEFH